jgi:hypothetical protein
MTTSPDRRHLLASALAGTATLYAGPGLASGGKKDAKEAGAASVQLGAIAIPITENGRLANYIFLNVRINLTIKADEAKLREKEPYFRDALVRVSSKVSFGQPGKDYLLDEPRFKQVMMAEWVKITGPGMIKSIDILAQNPKKHPL